MNLLDVRLGCNEQRTKHRLSATGREVDVVIVRPAARTFVVDRTTQLDRDGCTDRPGVDVRFEMQYGLMNMRRAFVMHEPEASEVPDQPLDVVKSDRASARARLAVTFATSTRLGVPSLR